MLLALLFILVRFHPRLDSQKGLAQRHELAHDDAKREDVGRGAVVLALEPVVGDREKGRGRQSPLFFTSPPHYLCSFPNTHTSGAVYPLVPTVVIVLF